jgi:hypothetical protein
MSDAISAFCRVFGFDDVPSGSSPQSRLQALGCLPDEDEVALAEVQRLDTAAAGPSAALATTFEAEILPLAPSSEAGADLAEGGDEAEGAAPSPGDA